MEVYIVVGMGEWDIARREAKSDLGRFTDGFVAWSKGSSGKYGNSGMRIMARKGSRSHHVKTVIIVRVRAIFDSDILFFIFDFDGDALFYATVKMDMF